MKTRMLVVVLLLLAPSVHAQTEAQPAMPAEAPEAAEQQDAAAEKAAAEKAAAEKAAAEKAAGAGAPKPNTVLTESEGKIQYGVALSLLRLSFARQEDEPARNRNYVPRLEKIAPEIGFQFSYAHAGAPWRIRTNDAGELKPFQLMTIGGAFLVRLSEQNVSRGGISIAAILGFFDGAVSLGMGIDLYRGIPVAGPTGARGEGTAYTGLTSWAIAREGELTPENVFFVFSVNLSDIGGER